MYLHSSFEFDGRDHAVNDAGESRGSLGPGLEPSIGHIPIFCFLESFVQVGRGAPWRQILHKVVLADPVGMGHFVDLSGAENLWFSAEKCNSGAA